MKFRILSLDGGGIRGAFAAAFLARIEEELAAPITDYFDLIAGTSTGGIIALALGLGLPAARVARLYEDHGKRIFTKRHYLQVPFFLRSKYDPVSLRASLTEVFGAQTLEEARASRLVIPAVDLARGKTVTFKTPHLPDLIRDRRIPVVDVALATSAAPVYFPPSVISAGTLYCDGGLWANNPAMVGYVEALKIGKVCRRPLIDPLFAPAEVFVLSIGTGDPQYYKAPPRNGDGLAWWGKSLVDVVSGSQSQCTHNQMRYLLDDQQYARMDFKMPAPWALDQVSVVRELLSTGTEKAIENYPKLRSVFLAEPKHPYHPFPSQSAARESNRISAPRLGSRAEA